MQNAKENNCMVCQQLSQNKVLLECGHLFCQKCLKQYITTLKKYHLLTPEKLICLAQNCKNQLSDQIISKIFPGEQGFILNMIKKRYKQSKDPSIQIFHCSGYLRQDRKNLIQKLTNMSRQEHSKLINEQLRKFYKDQKQFQSQKYKTCTNILSYNKFNLKQKLIQCYVCGASYCPKCSEFFHQGKCQQKKNKQQQLQKFNKNQNDKQEEQNIETFLKANQMIKCLNPKCQIPIAKQQGCFWVKCRCSWQFCYPCQKLWGDCQHFQKYPYKKFVPPAQWMIKALNLY